MNSKFKYFGLKSKLKIVHAYSFLTATIQDMDLFIVAGASIRRAEHEAVQNTKGLTFLGFVRPFVVWQCY